MIHPVTEWDAIRRCTVQIRGVYDYTISDLRMNRQYKDLEMETEMLNSSFDATKSTCFQSTNENNGTDLTVPELLPVFFFFLVNDHLVALRTHILWSKQPLYQD